MVSLVRKESPRGFRAIHLGSQAFIMAAAMNVRPSVWNRHMTTAYEKQDGELMGARAEVGGREARAAAMQSSETAQSRVAAGGGASSTGIHERRAERLTHGAKVKRGQLSAVQQGRYGTGPAPYGYRRGREGENPLEVDDAEAEVVRMIFREYLNTRSTGKVVEYLQSKGIATRKGNRWSRQAISIILSNRTYRGRVSYGEIETQGLHEAIIDPALFYKANALRERKRRNRSRR